MTSPAFPHQMRGFTLIEALVVLAIVALVAGLAYPGIERARTALAIRHARGQVLAALAGARVQALRSDGVATMVASRDGSAIALGGHTDYPLGNQGLVRVEMTPSALAFYPDGSVSGGEVRLVTPDGVTALAIAGDSGVVTMTERPHA